MIFAHIVAVLPNGVMAIDGQLPCGYWKEDMMFFSRTTQQALVFMGNRTTKTLPKRLENRYLVSIGRSSPDPRSDVHRLADVVITTNQQDKVWDASMKEIFSTENFPLANKEVAFVAGGAYIYQESLMDMDRVYLNVLYPFIPPLVKAKTELLHYPMMELQKHFVMTSKTTEESSKGVIEYQIWERRPKVELGYNPSL